MRSAFFQTLADIAAADGRILLLTADLGFRAVEVFADRCPRRFFNVGVSEQNMIGLATGLAEAGYIPFTYSITPFAVLRPYEFIRNGPVAHRLPVRIVGVGGGVEYGTNGISHYGIEDIGVLRVIPGLQLVAPADATQCSNALRAIADLNAPLYFRLSKNQSAPLDSLDGHFALGSTQTVRSGKDLLIVALGTAAYEAIQAAEILETEGISAAVELVDNLNGSVLESLIARLSDHHTAVTVEAHYVNGGLGSLVCELVAEHGLSCRVIRCGIDRVPDGTTGSQAFMQELHGISGPAIARRVGLALSASA